VSTVDVALEPVAGSIPLARDALESLRGQLDEARIDDMRLVVSELVTNSVRHANLDPDAWITLRVDAGPDTIRVEIHDDGCGFDADVTPTSMYQESGWGLFLISQIADRWGVSTDAAGTTVWLEIAR
jgi:anti-sigma regulatory factor (Ser/Thr protein kinase)